MKKKYDFKAHEGEIEDLDISPEMKVNHFRVFFFYFKIIMDSFVPIIVFSQST